MMYDPDGIMIRARPADSQWLLHADPRHAAAIAGVTGLLLGTETLRATVASDWHALHLSPDEWLLISQDSASDPTAMFSGLGIAHSLVDVSHRTVGREIVGAHAATVLAGACSLDLDHVPNDFCTRTLFGKITAVLWRRESVWRVDFPRSYEGYVDALLEAIVDGMGVTA